MGEQLDRAPPASQDRAGAPSGSSPVPGLEQSRSSTGAWPNELTPELSDILGRPRFMFIQFSRVYRLAGFDIPTSAEAEQAFFLHRFLGHWFPHGADWRAAAEADLREVYATAALAKARGETA